MAAMQWCFLGYPSEFVPAPLGAAVYQNMQTQVANGEAARMVLYDYDFCGGHLTQRGRDQLAKIASMMDHNFFPIVIERTPANPALAEVRRHAVLTELGAGPFPVPVARVVIGVPPAIGLSGREANIIYGNLLIQTLTRGINADPTLIQGTAVPTAGGGGGTAGSSGPTTGPTGGAVAPPEIP
jgi:hypothetical protein